MVCQYEAEVEHVHFPTTALISLLTILEDDDPVEAATVGREGLVGLSIALEVARSPHRAICQLDGECSRITAREFTGAILSCPGLASLVRRYAAFTIRSAGQMLACNALHTVESRASKWLLIFHDQAGRDRFPMTQEFMAFMLGVRRQTVSVVAGTLQDAGLIEYSRGSITVLDRDRLEDSACECYSTVRAAYAAAFSRRDGGQGGPGLGPIAVSGASLSAGIIAAAGLAWPGAVL